MMESPLTAPSVVDSKTALQDEEDEFHDDDDLPQFARRKSRSFDNASDIDLTYSEDLSPFPTLSFIPRKATQGAPILPNPSAKAEQGFTLNPTVAADRAPFAFRPEGRQERNLIFADYDLSDEEDDLLVGEENSLLEGDDNEGEPNQQNHHLLDTSHDTAPNMPTEPLVEKQICHARSASFSGLSPVENSNTAQSEVESLLDLTVPSLTPVPMRRVSSTPRCFMSPPPSQNERQQSSPLMKPRDSPILRVSSPYSLQRQQSVPSRTNGGLLRHVSVPSTPTAGRPKSPLLVFTDDAPKQTINGEGGTPKNRGGASIFRSGSIGSLHGLVSPSRGVVRTPSPTKQSRNQRDKSLERLTLSDPYALRRHSSLPKSASRIEFQTPTQNKPAYTQEKVAFTPDGPAVSVRKSSIGSKAWQEIVQSPTGATAEVESDYEPTSSAAPRRSLHNSNAQNLDVIPSDDSTRSKEEKIFLQRKMARYILYLGAFSIFGSTIRVFLVRIFGLSCEISDPTMDEFCITATGRTMQRGGALFADLPANMFGCFILGLMTSLQTDLWPPLPWFRPDHPLQQNGAYHEGIRTGLCGSITTYASWNAQMIVMMDGTNTELGSQVVPALFGYVIGFFCAIVSYLVGTHVATWISRWRNPELAREDDEEARLTSSSGRNELDNMDYSEQHEGGGDVNSTPPSNTVVLPAFLGTTETCHSNIICKGHYLPFVLVAILLSGYAVGGFVMQNAFYRTLFYSSLLTPPGALLRWELSRWNTRFDRRWRRLDWLPVGTFVANVVACLVSIALLSLETRYLFDDTNSNLTAISLITAVRAGFAGSLSTVSTMVKELFELNNEFPMHAKAYQYALLTVVTSIVLCISIYSPIVRSG